MFIAILNFDVMVKIRKGKVSGIQNVEENAFETTVTVDITEKHRKKSNKQTTPVKSKIVDHVEKDHDDKNSRVQSKKNVKKGKTKSKKKSKTEVSERKDEALHQLNAINYLKTWKENRCMWKFEKLKQIWLLKNPFSKANIPDSDFQTFAEYIAAAKGRARDNIEQRATRIVEAMEERQELLAAGMAEEELAQKHPELQLDEKSYKRARTLLQCFQDAQN